MENEKSDSLETIVAILIAIVVAIAALVTWRASLIDDASGDANYDGLRAIVNAEQTRAINYVNAYESYGNYVNYWRNSQLAALISTDLQNADEEQSVVLTEQLKNANDLADANRPMFQSRYLNRDGSYSVQRQLGEMWADAAKEKNLDYQSKFDEADSLRKRTNLMLFSLLILGISPIFLSLVESVQSKLKIPFVVLGVIFMVAGSVFAILVEFHLI